MKLHKIAKLASKARHNPHLQTLLFQNGKIVATDSFKLIEVTDPAQDTTINALVPAKNFKAGDNIVPNADAPVIVRKDKSVFTPNTLDPDQYPKYEGLIPTADRENSTTVSLNRQYLIDLLEAMPEDKHDRVYLNVSKDNNAPILITNQHANALLMPFDK